MRVSKRSGEACRTHATTSRSLLSQRTSRIVSSRWPGPVSLYTRATPDAATPRGVSPSRAREAASGWMVKSPISVLKPLPVPRRKGITASSAAKHAAQVLARLVAWFSLRAAVNRAYAEGV